MVEISSDENILLTLGWRFLIIKFRSSVAAHQILIFLFFFLYNFIQFKAFGGFLKFPKDFFLVINTFYCYCCSTSFFYSLGAAASLVDIFIFDRRCQAGSHFVSLELFSQCTVSLSTSALEGHLSNISHNLLWQSCFAFLCCFLYFPLFLDSYLYHNSS